MSKWGKISLYKFQRIDQIQQDKTYDDFEKVLFTACEAFDMTEHEMENAGVKVADRLVRKVKQIFDTEFTPVVPPRIGRYRMLYDISAYTFGQYIEMMFFFQQHIRHAHLVLATASRHPLRKYRTDGHKRRSEYFLTQPVETAMGAVKQLIENFESFNKQYSHLFGIDQGIYDAGTQDDAFNRRYGWTYSAKVVAEYEGIPLDQAYGLPVRQALNDLAYLKEKTSYEARQHEKLMKQHKQNSNGK